MLTRFVPNASAVCPKPTRPGRTTVCGRTLLYTCARPLWLHNRSRTAFHNTVPVRPVLASHSISSRGWETGQVSSLSVFIYWPFVRFPEANTVGTCPGIVWTGPFDRSIIVGRWAVSPVRLWVRFGAIWVSRSGRHSRTAMVNWLGNGKHTCAFATGESIFINSIWFRFAGGRCSLTSAHRGCLHAYRLKNATEYYTRLMQCGSLLMVRLVFGLV